MEKEKLGLESAFPNVHSEHTGFDSIGNKEFHTFSEGGISKRLYIATKAMQGYISGMQASCQTINPHEIVNASFEFADELLRQENNNG